MLSKTTEKKGQFFCDSAVLLQPSRLLSLSELRGQQHKLLQNRVKGCTKASKRQTGVLQSEWQASIQEEQGNALTEC